MKRKSDYLIGVFGEVHYLGSCIVREVSNRLTKSHTFLGFGLSSDSEGPDDPLLVVGRRLGDTVCVGRRWSVCVCVGGGGGETHYA